MRPFSLLRTTAASSPEVSCLSTAALLSGTFKRSRTLIDLAPARPPRPERRSTMDPVGTEFEPGFGAEVVRQRSLDQAGFETRTPWAFANGHRHPGLAPVEQHTVFPCMVLHRPTHGEAPRRLAQGADLTALVASS